MSAEKAVPARLHVLLRKKSAVVFRRGTTDYVASIGWDLETDTFRLGQWLHGRIYALRCDLSPDGKYLIYFAAKHGRRSAVLERQNALLKEKFKTDELWRVPWGLESKALDEINAAHKEEFAALRNSLDANEASWTAISRAPYLKAIDLWWKGDCWNGGGAFLSNKKVWLNHREFEFSPPVLVSKKFEVTNEPIPELGYGRGRGECTSIYFAKLARDGWVFKSSDNASSYNVLFEKELPGGLILQKRFLSDVVTQAPGRGTYFEEHRLADAAGTTLADGKTWEWADYDAPRKRVLFAHGGRLWALRAGAPLADAVLLKDFNDMTFEAVPAPY